jgi:hypothetical protein
VYTVVVVCCRVLYINCIKEEEEEEEGEEMNWETE